MTNEQKYKTAEERIKAFEEFCDSRDCESCEIGKLDGGWVVCALHWLALESEEKFEPCPFCGGKCITSNAVGGMWRVFCEKDMSCLYSSGTFVTETDAIAAHNRVTRAVRAAKKGEVK